MRSAAPSWAPASSSDSCAERQAAAQVRRAGYLDQIILRVASTFGGGEKRGDYRDSDRGFGGCVIFGSGIGKPPNRQGTALLNQSIDLLNHGIASKAVSGV